MYKVIIDVRYVVRLYKISFSKAYNLMAAPHSVSSLLVKT